MSYTTTYTDEKGKTHTVSINDADSREAIKNDYEALMKLFNPQLVRIERIQAQPGEMLHLQITTLAPSHYLDSNTDVNPKACNSMSAEIVVYLGYPLKAVKAYYPANHYLASPNVFRSGAACIDTWIPMTSSLLSVAEKMVMDMIHNPAVTRYDSPANASMIKWHQQGVAAGRFPTVSPRLITAVAPPALPARKARPATAPLPSRRR